MSTILVVDDDPVLQMTVARVLEQAGPAVVVADDGARRLARSQDEEAFDLPLLDVFTPGRDGFETMRCVLPQRPGLPIMTRSGRPCISGSMREPEYPIVATKLGVIHASPKPFKPAALLAMAADCLTLCRPDRDAVPNS